MLPAIGPEQNAAEAVSLLGDYVPGGSLLHRAPAGAKLLALLLLAIGTQLLPAWWQPVLLLALVVGLYPLTGIGLLITLRQLRALIWLLLAIGIAQVLLSSWSQAVATTATILLLVLAAGLVTLTTTVSAMSDTIVWLLRPFRRIGVNPERIGLLLALSIRAVPVVLTLADQVQDAQRARGKGFSARAFVVPLIVRTVRHAIKMGEALAARGLDD